MTDRILTTPTLPSANCAQLPSRETQLGRRDMRNTTGGVVFPGNDRLGRYVHFAIRCVAEVIEYMARPR